MFNKKQEIIRHDEVPNFIKLKNEIEKEYGDDFLGRIQAWENQDPKYRVMGIARELQYLLSMPVGDEVTVGRGQLDLIYRAIIDLSSHLQPNLPDGVHNYSYSNIRGVSKYIVEQLQGEQ